MWLAYITDKENIDYDINKFFFVYNKTFNLKHKKY